MTQPQRKVAKMAIRNLAATVAALRGFIAAKATQAHAKSLVLGLSGGADSALVFLLCVGIPEFKTIAVTMPVHSSGSAAGRARELAEKFGVPCLTTDLSPAHDIIATQAFDQLRAAGLPVERNNASDGALRSCLRAPTLDYFGKLTNGIIVGTGNRDEDEVTRYFQKRGDGAVDISPIAKLHKSEVYELLRFLGCTEAILNAVPTADLWGPDSGQEDEKQLGLSYPEIEWAIQMNDRSGDRVFDLNGDGSKVTPVSLLAASTAGDGTPLTPRQVQVIEQLRKMDLVSRHKAAMPPVFDPRSLADENGQPLFG